MEDQGATRTLLAQGARAITRIRLPHTYFSDDGAFQARTFRDSRLPAGKVAVGGWVKRLFDVTFAIVALLAFLPVMIVVVVALKLRSPGPVIFAHQRVGLGGSSFGCLKFRTMVVDADDRLEKLLASDPEAAAEFRVSRKLRHDPRIVPGIGHFLRKTSLDEVPQFFNVLLGHMSVVGPRPVTESEILEHYGTDHAYTDGRPGITGLWQVSGRNDVSYESRVRLDQTYLETWTLWRDLDIILKTACVVCMDRNGH